MNPIQKSSENNKETVKVFTVGHSNRQIDELIDILKHYKIKAVVDVRRFPTSTKFPHFKKEILKTELKKCNIKYFWLGKELGGYRNGGYRKYMTSKEYSMGIQKLLEIIDHFSSEKANVTLLCSEKLWFKCHRKFISSTLLEMGYKVVHIIEKDKAYIHKSLDYESNKR